MIQGVKWRIATWLVILFILVGQVQLSSAGEDYLTVRIVGAEYPPTTLVADDGEYSLFGFTIHLQIENPTQNPINVLYVCSPNPFPYLRMNLENKSLEAKLSLVFEWPIGNFSIPPGIRNESGYLGIQINNYLSEQLPLGEYEMWFDYTNCSYVPVPVITEGMIMCVSATNITFFFEYNSETQVVSTLQKTSYVRLFFFLSSFLLIDGYRRLKKQIISYS